MYKYRALNNTVGNTVKTVWSIAEVSKLFLESARLY